MEAKEGNKVIAEFMEKHLMFRDGKDWIDVGRKIILLEKWAKYHSSWDWLMPSWGKLSSLLLAKNRHDIIELFKDAVVKNDIIAAWKVILKGIQIVNE